MLTRGFDRNAFKNGGTRRAEEHVQRTNCTSKDMGVV
jgi:hypothetical protein